MSEKVTLVQAEILKNLSIDQLTPMQETFAEKAAGTQNLMLLAPTGSGKTLAFLLPLIKKLNASSREVQALIIAPSRELSIQIDNVFRNMKTGFKASCCYGGHSVKIEQNSLSEAPPVVIGTPGRIADHIRRHSFHPGNIKFIVLDEFDKSLEMGFQNELKEIFKSLKGNQQHLLTSATKLDPLPDFMPFTKIETLNHLGEAGDIKLTLHLIRCRSIDKVETLLRLVASFKQEVCLVFCNHRESVERISTHFRQYHFEHGILHGAMEQIDREKNLIKFRGGAHNVLVATDLASRGLDIPEIRHIIHYQLPMTREAFLHRNGRTARMHANGDSYLIIADDESVPEYIDKSVEEIKLRPKLELPPPPTYACLYISAGKKDKISKGDIVGLLTKKGELKSEEIGMIALLDHASYVFVKRTKADKAIAKLRNEKLKKSKVKIEIAH